MFSQRPFYAPPRESRDESIPEIYRKVEGKGMLEVSSHLNLPSPRRRVVLFEYPSDGIMIKGCISFLPEASEKPLLVFLRGGNRFHELLSPDNRWSFFQDYTVLATTYRGGMNEGTDEFGGEDVNDVKNLIDYLRTLEKQLGFTFTSKQKYMVGMSRGAMMMFLAFARCPKLQHFFDKVVSLTGLLDIELFLNNRPELKASFEKDFGYSSDPSWSDRRNPILCAPSIAKDFPILILQGSADRRVFPEEGYRMLEALKENRCSVEYLEVPGGDHCLENCPDAIDLIHQWLKG